MSLPPCFDTTTGDAVDAFGLLNTTLAAGWAVGPVACAAVGAGVGAAGVATGAGAVVGAAAGAGAAVGAAAAVAGAATVAGGGPAVAAAGVGAGGATEQPASAEMLMTPTPDVTSQRNSRRLSRRAVARGCECTAPLPLSQARLRLPSRDGGDASRGVALFALCTARERLAAPCWRHAAGTAATSSPTSPAAARAHSSLPATGRWRSNVKC